MNSANFPSRSLSINHIFSPTWKCQIHSSSAAPTLEQFRTSSSSGSWHIPFSYVAIFSLFFFSVHKLFLNEGVGWWGDRTFSPDKHVWKRSSFEVNLLVNSTCSIRHKHSTDVEMYVCVFVHTLPLSVWNKGTKWIFSVLPVILEATLAWT